MKDYRQYKTASPFPSLYTIAGRISITDFHGGTIPIYEPLGYKNTANGLDLRFNTASDYVEQWQR